MRQFKKIFIPLLFVLLLTAGCSQKILYDEFADSDAITSSLEIPDFSVSGTVITYKGTSYDLAERQGSINAINFCVPVGEVIVISCHTGPKNAVYCLFNTATQSFLNDMIGGNLIWYNDNIETSVYSFWNDVMLYDGTTIKSLNLNDPEYIDGLAYVNGYKQIEVKIKDDSDDVRVEIIDLHTK